MPLGDGSNVDVVGLVCLSLDMEDHVASRGRFFELKIFNLDGRRHKMHLR